MQNGNANYSGIACKQGFYHYLHQSMAMLSLSVRLHKNTNNWAIFATILPQATLTSDFRTIIITSVNMTFTNPLIHI